MRVAALDLGTNSFLCLICDVSDTGELSVVEDICRVVRLGEKVHANRFFLPEALERADKVLGEFAELISEKRVDQVVATATSAARDASNGEKLFELGNKHKIPITVVTGNAEAVLSFEGACSDNKNKASMAKTLVVDVGGGSTELIFQESDSAPLKAQSFDVGCVRLTEMFLKSNPVATDELNTLSKFAAKTLAAFGRVRPSKVIAVSGTPTTLASLALGVEFQPDLIEGYRFTKKNLETLTAKLASMSNGERAQLKGLDPMRADIIVAGGALLIAALDISEATELTVSTRGLRYGLALRYREYLNGPV